MDKEQFIQKRKKNRIFWIHALKPTPALAVCAGLFGGFAAIGMILAAVGFATVGASFYDLNLQTITASGRTGIDLMVAGGVLTILGISAGLLALLYCLVLGRFVCAYKHADLKLAHKAVPLLIAGWILALASLVMAFLLVLRSNLYDATGFSIYWQPTSGYYYSSGSQTSTSNPYFMPEAVPSFFGGSTVVPAVVNGANYGPYLGMAIVIALAGA